ncbi:hypothetical protein V493_05948 [Pseudogymnoascus sp. VKM F-4281 (FW-2241)]|nr:hypothetical protein V493_05948 [Pseudogymnoascus sp. VKM F-4281 (FW-2241)]
MADTGAVNVPAEPGKGTQKDSNSGNVAVDKTKVAAAEVPKEEKKMPPLSASDFKAYNGMAEHMEYFHNHFRSTWNLLYSACENNSRPKNMSIKQFITTGLQFCGHLTAHHSIEEQHIFPILAKKMPEFKNGPKYKGAAELLRQHKEIHHGMDIFQLYLQQCQTGEADFDLRVLKTKMESWGEVLWTHLDQEVKTLGAENMRKYWTVEEMKRMPM